GAKVGGPNYLLGLNNWTDDPVSLPAITDIWADELFQALTPIIEDDDAAWVQAAVAHDAQAVETFIGQRDVSDLQVEINALRYRPVPVRRREASITSGALAQSERVAFGRIRAQQGVHTRDGTGLFPTNVVSLPTPALRQL